MSPDDFINAALDAGSRNGIEALDADQRLVYLVSQAEVLCDMEGIDSFLDYYNPDWLEEAAAAFEAVGAQDIANGFRSVRPDTDRNDPLLDRLNELVTSRAGYDYEAIRRVVEARLTSRSS